MEMFKAYLLCLHSIMCCCWNNKCTGYFGTPPSEPQSHCCDWLFREVPFSNSQSHTDRVCNTCVRIVGASITSTKVILSAEIYVHSFLSSRQVTYLSVCVRTCPSRQAKPKQTWGNMNIAFPKMLMRLLLRLYGVKLGKLSRRGEKLSRWECWSISSPHHAVLQEPY